MNPEPSEDTSDAKPPFWTATSLVLFAALCVRCAAVVSMSGQLNNDPDAYWRLAENLVSVGTFGEDATPTAYRPPLYPLVLTPCVALGEHGRAAVGLLHVLLGVATAGMVLRLAQRWGLRRRGAAVAALLVACDPILLRSSAEVMTETLAVFLTTAGLLAVTRVRGGRGPAALVAGIVLGLGALCRPALLLWAVAVGVVFWRQIFADRRRQPATGGRLADAIRLPWAFIVGAAVVLAPWAIRNEVQFGRPIVTTTHGGYTLLLANNPSFYDWLHTGAWGSVWRGDEFNTDWQARRPADEIQADRLAYAEAWQTIRREPGTFLRACVVRIGRFWSPLPHQLSDAESLPRRLSRYAVALWYVAEFALAIFGIRRLLSIRLPISERPSGAAAARTTPCLWGCLLTACLMAGHLVYWTDMRMRAPIMPVVAFFAAGMPAFGRKTRNRLVRRDVIER